MRKREKKEGNCRWAASLAFGPPTESHCAAHATRFSPTRPRALPHLRVGPHGRTRLHLHNRPTRRPRQRSPRFSRRATTARPGRAHSSRDRCGQRPVWLAMGPTGQVICFLLPWSPVRSGAAELIPFFPARGSESVATNRISRLSC
jgi:hypothetical protein